jgi:hypothetical protein
MLGSKVLRPSIFPRSTKEDSRLRELRSQRRLNHDLRSPFHRTTAMMVGNPGFRVLYGVTCLAWAVHSAGRTVTSEKTFDFGDFKVRVSRTGGHSILHVTESVSSKPLFDFNLTVPGLVDCRRWSTPNGIGIWLTLEYYSGNSSRIMVCGQDHHGKWKTLLNADSEYGTFQPPEVVDLRGTGVADIITIKNVGLLHDPRRFDPTHTTCSIWRWNNQKDSYVDVRDCLYTERLKQVFHDGLH